MKRLHYVFMAALILIGLSFVIYFGYTPTATSIMPPAHYSQPEEIGAAMYREVGEGSKKHAIVAFGIQPEYPSHKSVLQGFLRAALSDGQSFDLIIHEPQMPPLEGYEGIKTLQLSFSHDMAGVLELVRKHLEDGQRIFIYSSTFYTSHVLPGNPVRRFEEEWKEQVLSVSTTQLALRRDQETSLFPSCVGAAQDQQRLNALGCVMLHHARKYYRDQIDPAGRFVATADKHGPGDYLIYVHPPTGFRRQLETPTSMAPPSKVPAS